MWSSDEKWIYYVSEFYGTPANIVRMPSTPVGNADASTVTAAPPQQITFHKDDAVRRARISANGEWIVYECGADLWVVSTKEGSAPRKLAIEADADDKVNPERPETFTNRATEFVVSPDEKHAVFAVHGKLFLTPISGAPRAVQLTDGESMDHGAAWAPDGNRVLFVSDRGGHEDVYALDSADADHPRLIDAHKFKVARLTDTPDPEFGVGFSPDGKHVSFLRDGRLWTMNPDGSNPKVVVDRPQVFDYDWSPDSKWLVYARRDGASASELYIVPAGGATAAGPGAERDALRHLQRRRDLEPGRKEDRFYRRAARQEQPAGAGPAEAAGAGRRRRRRRRRPWTSTGTTSTCGRTRSRRCRSRRSPSRPTARRRRSDPAATCGSATTNGGQTTRLTTGGQQPRMIQWSRKKLPFGGYADLIYFLDGQGTLRVTRSTPQNGSDGKPDSTAALVPFKVKLTVRTDEEFTEMFDQTWRYLSENFYDVKFHGHDWDAVRAKYRPLVKYVAMKEDLYTLLYLMMGELNASHLGVGGYAPTPEEQTAELGLVWDEAYRGKGLRVLDVLKRGPADGAA